MDLNKILRTFFIVGTGAILAYAGFYGYQQQLLLRKMKISFAGAIFDNVSIHNFAMRIKLKFTNLSDIDISVDAYDFDVLINGQKVMKILSPGPGNIYGNSETVNVLSINFDPTTVLSKLTSSNVLMSLLFDYSKIILTLQGKMSVSHVGIGVHDLAINQSSTLAEIMQSGKPA